MSETYSNSYYLLKIYHVSIRNLFDLLEYDPKRFNIIEGRLNKINRLKRKYGKTIEEILEYYSDIEEEIEEIENRESHIRPIIKSK